MLQISSIKVAQLRDETLDRLGDLVAWNDPNRLWSDAEMESYLADGYRQLGLEAGCFWDMAYLEDLPYTATHDFAWEQAYFPRGWTYTFAADISFDWESDYKPNASPAGNHSFTWERTYIQADYISAVAKAPGDFYEIQRATWNWTRLEAAGTMSLRGHNQRFEIQRGQVLAYAMDKDGLTTFRKWMPPYARASTLSVYGMFGIIRGAVADAAAAGTTLGFRIDEFRKTAHGIIDATDRARFVSVGFTRPGGTVVASPGGFGAWPEMVGERVVPPDTYASPLDPVTNTPHCFGIPRIFPGHHPIQRPWGLPRRVYFDDTNTRIEYLRRGHTLSQSEGFELPDWYTVYVRFYASWKALERDGPGQDLDLAGHYRSRYLAGVARLKARVDSVQRSVIRSMGQGKRPDLDRVSPPSLPWNYGSGDSYWGRG